MVILSIVDGSETEGKFRQIFHIHTHTSIFLKAGSHVWIRTIVAIVFFYNRPYPQVWTHFLSYLSSLSTEDKDDKISKSFDLLSPWIRNFVYISIEMEHVAIMLKNVNNFSNVLNRYFNIFWKQIL